MASDGLEALERARETLFGLIVIDAKLPELSGFDLCRLLKANRSTAEIPIIVLSFVGDEIERVVAFELGADDYLQKPFSQRELILRMQAILRRKATVSNEFQPSWRMGGLEIDESRHEVTVNGAIVRLTAIEFRLLSVLVTASGCTQRRDTLLKKVWRGKTSEHSRTVDTHIGRLRAKLGEAANIIQAVRGFGYRIKTDCV